MQTLIANEQDVSGNEPAAQRADHNSSRHFVANDRGGVTYVPRQSVGTAPIARSESLADVRVLVDAMEDLVKAHHAFWPKPYPIPEDVHCALLGANYALARVRAGTLRKFAEVCDR
jgi:hypothetical protein